jgi:hypothetical protein
MTDEQDEVKAMAAERFRLIEVLGRWILDDSRLTDQECKEAIRYAILDLRDRVEKLDGHTLVGP